MSSLRKQVKGLVKQQTAESWKALWNSKLTIGEYWTFVSPSKCANFIFDLVHNGRFGEFLENLTEDQQHDLCAKGNDYVVKEVLIQDTSKVTDLFSRIPFRMQEFFYSKESYSVFSACNLEQKLYVVEMCSEQIIIDYLSKHWTKEKRAEILDFLEAIEDTEIAKAIFKTIANALWTETIAQLLEMAKPNTTGRILEEIKEKEKLSAVCLKIADEKFYQVLEKCNFSILLQNSTGDFPIGKLNQDEQKKLCFALEERKIDKLYQKLGMEGIIQLYSAVELKDKGYILKNSFSKSDGFDAFYLFYTEIDRANKMDMIEVLSSDESDRKLLGEILEKKEKEHGLTFLEEAALKDLRAGMSRKNL